MYMLSVGIVNFNKENMLPMKLIEQLASMKCAIYMIHYYDDYITIIKNTPEIKHWFFSGSDYNPNSSKSPKMNEKILDIENKKFMMICYSMEIFCKLLGYNLGHDDESTKKVSSYFDGYFNKTIEAWRNHQYFLLDSTESKNESIEKLGILDNKVMTAMYKKKSDFLLLQWHPPYTKDGVDLLKQWLV